MAVETVGVRLSLTGARQAQQSVSQFNSELDRTDSTLRRVSSSAAAAATGLAGIAGRSVMGAARGLATTLLGVATAASAVGAAATVSLVKTGVAYNDLEQRASASFKTILGSQEAATKLMGDIRDFGRTSPFPRQAFIEATQQMLGFGFAAKDVIPLLTKINDAAAATGSGAQGIATMTDVFSQMRSQGKVSLDQLNRLSAIGINGVEAIAQATKTSQADVRKSISKGNIDAQTATDALTTYMEKRFAGASENVKKTWSGATDRVKGAWRDLGSAIVQPFISTGGGGLAVEWANRIADGLRKAANAAPGVLQLLRTGHTDGAALAKILSPAQFDAVLKIVRDLRDAFTSVATEAGHYSTNIKPGQVILDALVGSADLFRRTIQGVVGLFALLARGDYTGNLQAAFGWAEDSKPIDYLFRIRDGFLGLYDLVVNGDYSGKLRSAFGWEEDSKPVDILFRIRDAVLGVIDGVRGFDFSDIQGSLGSIWVSLQTLTPAFKAFHDALPSTATMAGLAGNALTLLAAALGFAADHVDLLVKAAPYLAGAYALWSVGSRVAAAAIAVTNARMILGNAVTLLNISANRAHTAALLQNAAAIRGVTVAELQAQVAQKLSLRQRLALTIASWREVAGLAAQKVAMIASTVVTRAAAAGQWLLNAAMSANPIGIVIALILALVAGLVWFFTKTELGQAIWTKVWGGIQAATAWVVSWFTGTALPAIQGFFQGVADKAGAVVDWVRDHWKLLLAIITGPIGAAVILVATHWSDIRAGAETAFKAVGSVVQSVIDKVQSFITKLREAVSFIKDKLVGAISSVPGGSAVLGALGIDAKATGGPITAGRPTLVGEKGPEMILPRTNGTVISNERLAQFAQPSATDLEDLQALASVSGTQVIQLVVDRKVLAQTTVGGLAALQARK